ncbi:MAG: gliding motility-associated C-terminal domain-containing protein [Cytophagaceae bacterium]
MISIVRGEGTKELMPNPSTGQGYVQIFDRGRLFATYNSPTVNRLNIRICNPGEVINMGFNQPDNDIYFRLKDPNGNIVMAAQALPTSGAGFIPDYTSAVAGPTTVNASGYTPITYTTTMAGDYYIEFNPTSPTTINSVQRIFTYFDITVSSGTNPLLGRLWSLIWDINTNNVNNPFYGKMYIYSKDSIVTSVDFNGIQPFGATISANSRGLTNTGNVVADRASRVGDFSYPEYKLFLNNPDENCFPTGFFGSITGPSTITGCGNNRCINVFVNKAGEVELLLDLNGTPGYQKNTADIIRVVQVNPGVNCIPWDAKNNLGQDVAQNTSFPIQLNYINGITHLPLYDVEHHRNGYIVDLIRPLGPRPNLYWDDSALQGGTVLDSKTNLNGCVPTSGCHRWQNRGDNNCGTECPQTINTWWYPNIISDNIQFVDADVTIDADSRNTPGAINDTLICSSHTQFQLSGIASGNAVGGVRWIGGSGNFIGGRNIRNPIYEPTAMEKNSGDILLYFETIPSAVGCTTKRDSMRIRLEVIPSVQLPSDTVLCAQVQSIFIQPAAVIGSRFQWTGGLGNYSNTTTSTTSYTPLSTELTSTIPLTLTAFGNVCNSVSDVIQISFLPFPIIQVIDSIKLCSGRAVNIFAGIQHATSTEWYKGSSVLSSTAQVVYTPLSSEYIYIRSNNSLNCQVRDSVYLSIVSLPTSVMVDSIKICENQSVLLTSNTTNASSVQWIKNNSIQSSQATYSYVPSQSEYIYLRLFNSLNCSVNDSVYIKLDRYPILSLSDIQSCIITGHSLNATPSNLPLSNVTFDWYKNGTSLNLSTPSIPVSDFGIYEVKVTNGLCETIRQSNVSISNRPVSLLPEEYTYCEDQTTSVSISTGSNAAYTYDWFPNVGNTATVTVSQSGWYKVKISGSIDCYVWDSIYVQSICPPEIHTPNAFSPNGDSANDGYIIYGKHIGKYKLMVFNRWGEIIFQSTSLAQSWDGKYLGDFMPIGTYPWIIEYEGDSEEFKGPYRLDGSVTIVK